MNEFGIVETATEQDGKLTFTRSQDVQTLIDRNRAEAEFMPSMHGQAAVRKVGSIPLVVAEEWARECGCAVGTAGFADHVKRKLADGDFAAFRIKGF